MEPKVILYLKRIVKTISIALIWMIINTKLGINSNYAFVEGSIKTGNIVFYIWFMASLIAMLFYLYKVWKEDLNFDED
jgi:hypothetical protein